MCYRKQLLLVLLICTFSCDQKTLREIENHEGLKKVYFFKPDIDMKEFGINDSLQKKHGNFYVDDNEILNEIGANISNKIVLNKFSGSIYLYRYYLNGSYEDGGFIDLLSGYLANPRRTKFNVEELFKHSDSFIKLESFKINCHSLKYTKRLVDYVKLKKGFVVTNIENGEDLIKNYNGQIVVEINPETFGISYINSEENIIPKRIQNQFSGFGDVHVLNYEYHMDSLFLATVLVRDNDFSKLPDGYHMKKDFSSKVDFPIFIYDLKEDDLRKYFEIYDIEEYTITEL